jgi:hypothetical protein
MTVFQMIVHPVNLITRVFWKLVADIWKLYQNLNASSIAKYCKRRDKRGVLQQL